MTTSEFDVYIGSSRRFGKGALATAAVLIAIAVVMIWVLQAR